MVILKIHFGYGITFKSESNPPVGRDSNTVFAFSSASERMKLPARHSRYLRNVVGKFQSSQNRFDLPDGMSRQAARIITCVKASEAFVPELPENHKRLYGTTVRMSNNSSGQKPHSTVPGKCNVRVIRRQARRVPSPRLVDYVNQRREFFLFDEYERALDRRAELGRVNNRPFGVEPTLDAAGPVIKHNQARSGESEKRRRWMKVLVSF
jgi:hypothetical protein